MIIFTDNVFKLSTSDSSYWFRITQFGHLEHIYYAGLLPDDQPVEPLALKRTAQIGDSVLYDESDNTYCLDTMCLEWSGVGKGDYRNMPAEIKMPDGTFTADFVYQSHRVIAGCVSMETLPSAYGGDGDCETLEITLRDESNNVIYIMYTKGFSMIDAYAGVKEYAFISYSHKDSGLVFSSLEYLSGLGYRLWYDEGIDVSTLWVDKIAEKIKNADCFLCFISSNSMSLDSFVRNEIHLARKYKKKIIPIYIDDMEINDGIALLIGDIQGIVVKKDKKGTITDVDMKKLCKTLPSTIYDSIPPIIDNDDIADRYYLIYKNNDFAYYVLETNIINSCGGMYELNIVEWNFDEKRLKFLRNGHFLLAPEIHFLETHIHNIYLAGNPVSSFTSYRVDQSLCFNCIVWLHDYYKSPSGQFEFAIRNPFKDNVETVLIDTKGKLFDDDFGYGVNKVHFNSRLYREALHNNNN